MFDHVLVVCTGNICRSPVAAAMLRRRRPELRVDSAGLGAMVGQGVEPNALQLALAEGLDLESHQARQLDSAMLASADLVLVMSDGQRREIANRWPETLGKTMRLGQWLDAGKGRDIPDPYRKSREVFTHVHQLLVDATEGWASRL
ncbi:low molecular weight protein-tyrosine-phosphatase [Halomonas salipaludis]|uniref:protein-tyrosine-phosphatase n=1 Tax=Halomonas salipaludis TaxID=2032625 RepID=A0A2A2EPA2_9GAMM|nr:low molecular weight protein-tyrosine-phosphatase [Halomonas salipaludis]PAU74205.1 phosphotyrosine protein phosphatase [Halomonas salipaludis]